MRKSNHRRNKTTKPKQNRSKSAQPALIRAQNGRLSGVFKRHRGKLFSLSLLAAGAGIGIVNLINLSSNLIDARSDTKILAACPQIKDVKTVRIYVGDITTNFGGKRENIVGDIRRQEQPAVITTGFGFAIALMPQPDPHDVRFRDLDKAPRNARRTYNISSLGGEFTVSATYAHLMQKSSATIVTNIEKIAASGATLMAFAGTEGHRWVSSDALIIVHATRGILKPKDVKPGESRLRFQQDFPEDSKEHEALAKMNDWIRTKYREFSTTGITEECVATLIRGKDDIVVPPLVSLRFGWTDTVKEIGWYSGEYTGYVTVRADDPRATGRTQPPMLEARIN